MTYPDDYDTAGDKPTVFGAAFLSLFFIAIGAVPVRILLCLS